jgi:CDP-diacylglycerol--serine O-phosphatidyltransferase
VLVVLFTGLLISYPWEVLSIGSVLYLAAIPVAYLHYKKLESVHLAVAAGTAHAPPQPAEEDRPGRLN